MNKKHRIYIVDDHVLVREGLRSLIGQQPDLEVVGEAGAAAEALAGMAQLSPDLVLLDLSLQAGSGLDLIKDSVIRFPKLPIVVVSMHDEMIYAERTIRAGARGYVMKSESSHQVIDAIRRVLNGKIFISDHVMAAIATKLGKPKRAATPVEALSDRELQVFEAIGQGLSTSDIAERMNLSVKTVQVYFARAKEKFGVTSARELLREAYRWHDAGGAEAAH